MKHIFASFLVLVLAGCHWLPSPSVATTPPKKRAPFVATPCSTINECAASIKSQVEHHWIFEENDIKNEMSVTLGIELNDKFEVISVVIWRPSGNERFDRNAVRAVQTAQPFVQLGGLNPDDLAKFRKVVFKFRPLEFESEAQPPVKPSAVRP